MISRNWQIHERRSVEARGIGEENSSRGWILIVDSPYVFSLVVYSVCAQSSYIILVSRLGMRIHMSVHFCASDIRAWPQNDNTFINLLWLGPCKLDCINSIRRYLLVVIVCRYPA